MSKLGTVIKTEFDPNGYEIRTRFDAVAGCPKCGRDVELFAETDAWTKGDDGCWHHQGYGGAMGVCERCNVLIANCLSDGFRAFDLER